MADWDDAAALQTQRESTSAAPLQDQSLHTATATSRSEERQLATQVSGESSEAAALLHEPAIPLQSTESSDPGASELKIESSGLAALRLELALVRRELEEDIESDIVNDNDTGVNLTATDDSSNVDTLEYQVLPFGEGVYRGQARLHGSDLELDAWVPHGLGVLTSTMGHTSCGQWFNGVQVNYGTRYGPTLQYEGDCGTAASTRECYGVGLYTFKELFVGCWGSSGIATTSPKCSLQPRGLGRLQSPVDTLPVDGWFNGLRCTHRSLGNESCSFNLASSLRSHPQPLRGLLVADAKLVFWRRRALFRALCSWNRLCCEFSASKAKSARLLALTTQEQARRAAQRAVHENLQRLKTERSQASIELLNQLAQSRVAQDQRTQRRQLYAQRLTTAIKQRDLAQVCVAKQKSAVNALELELQEVSKLLQKTRQAQSDCAQYVRELHLLKNQVENASVKLNAARSEQRRRDEIPESLQQSEEYQRQRSVLITQGAKSPRHRQDSLDNNSMIFSKDGNTHRDATLGQEFVCDVPGCRCGIPRDVFLRVAAALNDE